MIRKGCGPLTYDDGFRGTFATPKETTVQYSSVPRNMYLHFWSLTTWSLCRTLVSSRPAIQYSSGRTTNNGFQSTVATSANLWTTTPDNTHGSQGHANQTQHNSILATTVTVQHNARVRHRNTCTAVVGYIVLLLKTRMSSPIVGIGVKVASEGGRPTRGHSRALQAGTEMHSVIVLFTSQYVRTTLRPRLFHILPHERCTHIQTQAQYDK